MEERKHRGWSQRELADHLGTTQHNVSRWEAGATTPGPYFRTKLGELFGVPVQELLVPESNAHPADESEVERVAPPLMGVEKNARQAALAGYWDGTVHQEGELEHRITLRLKLVGRTIRGEGHLHGVYQRRDLTQPVTVRGRCVYDRFLKLEYTLREPIGAIQFGFILLEFAPDGRTLRGFF